MKKILLLICALALVLFCVACANMQESGSGIQGTKPVSGQSGNPPQTIPEVRVDNPVDYLMLSICREDGRQLSMIAYDDGMGNACLEYTGEEKKIGEFPLSVLDKLTEKLIEAGIQELAGQSVTGDGSVYGEMSVTFVDGTAALADYTGVLPREFEEFYNAVDSFFQELTAHLGAYVAMPAVIGEVDEDMLTAIMEIMGSTGADYLDGFAVQDVPVDEAFAEKVGLSNADGVVAGVSCGPMMSATAYSLFLVKADTETAAQSISEDFAENVEWNRWVCVSADRALIARKEDMVLCLVAADSLYEDTARSVELYEWEILHRLKRG